MIALERKDETEMTENPKNQGEGNRTAARRYNKDTRDFVKSGKVEKTAEKAREVLESDEGERLKRAEEKGRAQARR
jgi:hypothetical protein